MNNICWNINPSIKPQRLSSSLSLSSWCIEGEFLFKISQWRLGLYTDYLLIMESWNCTVQAWPPKHITSARLWERYTFWVAAVGKLHRHKVAFSFSHMPGVRQIQWQRSSWFLILVTVFLFWICESRLVTWVMLEAVIWDSKSPSFCLANIELNS